MTDQDEPRIKPSQIEKTTTLDEKNIATVPGFQRSEITEYHLYKKLAKKQKYDHNRQLFQQIAEDELRHYKIWKTYTGKDVRPRQWFIIKYFWITRLFGLTFGIKLMESGEKDAQKKYEKLEGKIPQAREILEEEHKHENALVSLIEEEKLKYVGSVVLGLNDALVELTGALAGLTFALNNTRLVALAGLITGIAASLSMAASEYLSAKSEDSDINAMKSCLYTRSAYVVTVAILIAPYLLLQNIFISLALTLLSAVGIIFVFNYYISVAKDLNFKRRFLEMSVISLGVAGISFGIGFLIRMFLGLDV